MAVIREERHLFCVTEDSRDFIIIWQRLHDLTDGDFYSLAQRASLQSATSLQVASVRIFLFARISLSKATRVPQIERAGSALFRSLL